MPIFKPSELHQLLSQQSLKARKQLSQNFLIDGNIVKNILAAASIKKGDVVLEIGPGPGALTEALLDAGAHVIAVEMDHFFAQLLSRYQTEDQRLEVIEGDFLKFALEEKFPEGSSRAKVVANLPYHITTPILERLLPLYTRFESLTVMVQKEVAQRFVAKKGTPEYSSFTLFLYTYCLPKLCFTVAENCFFPKPRVQSAVVNMTLIQPEEASADFFKLTRTAFGQRRKMLRSSLKELYPLEKLEKALSQMGLDSSCRPEELSLEQFRQLFFFLRKAD
jgi:16S rRNA (adenine1518-N6/adenine1519-N6)-dimethyltransferase